MVKFNVYVVILSMFTSVFSSIGASAGSKRKRVVIPDINWEAIPLNCELILKNSKLIPAHDAFTLEGGKKVPRSSVAPVLGNLGRHSSFHPCVRHVELPSPSLRFQLAVALLSDVLREPRYPDVTAPSLEAPVDADDRFIKYIQSRHSEMLGGVVPPDLYKIQNIYEGKDFDMKFKNLPLIETVLHSSAL